MTATSAYANTVVTLQAADLFDVSVSPFGAGDSQKLPYSNLLTNLQNDLPFLWEWTFGVLQPAALPLSIGIQLQNAAKNKLFIVTNTDLGGVLNAETALLFKVSGNNKFIIEPTQAYLFDGVAGNFGIGIQPTEKLHIHEGGVLMTVPDSSGGTPLVNSNGIRIETSRFSVVPINGFISINAESTSAVTDESGFSVNMVMNHNIATPLSESSFFFLGENILGVGKNQTYTLGPHTGTLVGDNGTIGASTCTGVGRSVNMSGQSGTGVGHSAIVSGASGVGLGAFGTVSGLNGIYVGANSTATQTNTTVLGKSSNATMSRSNVWGDGITSLNPNSFLWGIAGDNVMQLVKEQYLEFIPLDSSPGTTQQDSINLRFKSSYWDGANQITTGYINHFIVDQPTGRAVLSLGNQGNQHVAVIDVNGAFRIGEDAHTGSLITPSDEGLLVFKNFVAPASNTIARFKNPVDTEDALITIENSDTGEFEIKVLDAASAINCKLQINGNGDLEFVDKLGAVTTIVISS